MRKRRGARLSERAAAAVTGVVATGVVMLALAPAAWAQTTPATTATTTTTTTVARGGNSLVAQNDALVAVVLALGFGLIAIAAVLLFLSRDRKRTFDEISTLTAAGASVVARSDSAIAGDSGVTKGLRGGAPVKSPPEPAIFGPNVLSVGVTAPYQLQPAEGTDATLEWSVTGPGKLSTPTSATDVELTATAVGTISLTVAVTGGSGSTPKPLGISVVSAPTAPSGASEQLSVLGLGFGTVVIALAVASVTATLGLTDVLDGQAVAGILGSLVTYSVIRGASAANSGTGTATGTGTTTPTG